MQKSVLIVENDANQARIIRKYLENNGFEVACFVDSSEALENFYLDVNYYAIVLTDFRLKGMSGTKFAKEIRKVRGKGIVILLMTTYFMDTILRESEVANVINKVIVKPFSLELLVRTISLCLSHSY